MHNIRDTMNVLAIWETWVNALLLHEMRDFQQSLVCRVHDLAHLDILHLLQMLKFDYGKSEKDPVENYLFYKKMDKPSNGGKSESPNKEQKGDYIEKETVSYMLPTVFKV